MVNVLVVKPHDPFNVTGNRHREIGVIDHKARFCPTGLFYMFFLNIVDFHLLLVPPLGVVCGKAGRFLEGAVGQLRCIYQLYHHMGAGHVLCVEPPIVASGKLEGKLVIL